MTANFEAKKLRPKTRDSRHFLIHHNKSAKWEIGFNQSDLALLVSLLKSLKPLMLLYNLGSRAQKSTKIAQKTGCFKQPVTFASNTRDFLFFLDALASLDFKLSVTQ